MKKVSSLSIILLCIALSCNGDKDQLSAEIRTIDIGNQTWGVENLNVFSFQNGDSIPQAKDINEAFEWSLEKKPFWCYYNFDDSLAKTYGKLYNWYAVNDSRGLAPKGWKVASKNDWETLINYACGIYSAGNKLKSDDPDLWLNFNGNSNDFGFSAKPGGILRFDDQSFYFFDGTLRRLGAWWTKDSNIEDNAFGVIMRTSPSSEIEIKEEQKQSLLSVKIIKEKPIREQKFQQTKPLEITKIMTYKSCECHDLCFSEFVDENGKEYNFGDLTDRTPFNFQCYPNNAEGGVTDRLCGQKFKVTVVHVYQDDYELISISRP